MQQTAKPEFRVERSEIYWTTGYDYKFIFEEDRPNGDAQLILNRLRSNQSLTKYIGIENLGLNPDDVHAHLNEFYPNGRGLDEQSGEYMRQGIGTEALELIINDALEQNARVMFVYTSKESMIKFLDKNGFTFYGPNDRMAYKLLESR